MNDIMGTGWRFPIRVNARGSLDWSTGEQSVAEAVWIILSTPRRSRIMEPSFGCGIHDRLFTPDGPGTRAAIEDEVRQALVRFEPRIDVLRVGATAHQDQPNMLLIEVDYRIRANNAEMNIVYPFYLNEGSG
ncbi:GPW/gp25 family protein [Glutamicibacter sp. MNS18]|uniref:GPW/gp25 family protein n=1 Tax=Glutamicibacter sp. MNS18 TaxID=2989817 RepID=UPI00223583DC|nr:GPW/gp25 family protein [Glutamicibacter sp. MNS18]MCW4464558.1 GPW/gp25 family protein [Glutamicibacter sp. MNS18]